MLPQLRAASGWSTKYSFKNIDFPSFFRFTVAMRVAPLRKSHRHAHSVTERKRDCALSDHDRDKAVRTARTEYNRHRPVVRAGSRRGWGWVTLRRSLIPWPWSIGEEETAALY